MYTVLLLIHSFAKMCSAVLTKSRFQMMRLVKKIFADARKDNLQDWQMFTSLVSNCYQCPQHKTLPTLHVFVFIHSITNEILHPFEPYNSQDDFHDA